MVCENNIKNNLGNNLLENFKNSTGKPTIIVGINDSHDASACVVIDGKLICAVSEERLQRIKNMGGFPQNAIEECLKIAGITKEDVNYVAVANIHVGCENLHNLVPSLGILELYKIQEEYWQPALYENKDVKMVDVLPDYKSKGTLYYPVDKIPFANNRELDPETIKNLAIMRKTFIAQFFNLPEEKIYFNDHHLCHAYYAHYVNPNRSLDKDYLVLTGDGGGDHTYDSVNVVRNGKLQCLYKSHDNIIAKIYSAITLILGMKPHEHEYKVMGLAPYAKEYNKIKPRAVFREALTVEGIKFKKNSEMKDFFKYFQDKLKCYRFDGIAGGLQDFTEERLVEWVLNCIEHTKINNIVLSGGLWLNIKANKKVMELPEVESLFVPPAAGDESLSIGACYALIDKLAENSGLPATSTIDNSQHNNLQHENSPPAVSSPAQNINSKIEPLRDAYLGTEVTAEDVQEFLNHPLVKEKYELIENASPEQVAEILCSGEICAFFSGRMEFGPRALGHRSIITDPSKIDSVRKINEAIKKRDFWMPFTPSVLSERIDDYIVNPKNVNCSFMTVSFDSTPLGKQHLTGAIHPYDQTVRPQRVEKNISPDYYAVIKEFERRTGIGAVLNTSLNIHGKPIIRKPVEIAEELLADEGMELNNIYVNGYLLKKRIWII